MRSLSVSVALVALIPGLSAGADTVPIGSLAKANRIVIEGIVTDIVDDGFVLADGTGAVRVDTGPDWFHDLDLAKGEKLKVVGAPDEDGFDAFSLERLDGTTLTIRAADGPPPWAGGRRDG